MIHRIWERISDHTSDKKTCTLKRYQKKDHLQLKNPSKKGTQGETGQFSKGGMQMINKCIKKIPKIISQ